MSARNIKFHCFGSVSSGTMRPEDLIPSLTWELGRNCGRITRAHRSLVAEAGRMHDREAAGWQGVYASDAADAVLLDLFDALACYAPPYAYFGAHPGDGSDYGFWLSEGFEHDFDGLRVDDLAAVPKGYSGEALQVSDHGNITLYAFTRGRGREVWGLV